jgi:hypothetical protein
VKFDEKGGLEVSVIGKSQTLEAIQSMVSAHVVMIDDLNGWMAKVEKLTTGAKLIVTAKNASETAHIRGLGFYGLMVSGSHHQTHHLGIARGEAVHKQ